MARLKNMSSRRHGKEASITALAPAFIILHALYFMNHVNGDR